MVSAARLAAGAESQRSRAIVAGVIGNVLEWFDFGVYGYFVSTISQLFFPSNDPLASLLLTFAVFGVGFVMRPVGSILFGIYGDRFGRRKALSAVIFLMALLDPGDRSAADLSAGRRPRANPARHYSAAAGSLGRRRMGRIDRLSRGIRPRGSPRLYRVLAAGQRGRRVPAGFAERGLHQPGDGSRRGGLLGLARPVHSRHRGRAARCLSALAARRHAQIHRARRASRGLAGRPCSKRSRPIGARR